MTPEERDQGGERDQGAGPMHPGTPDSYALRRRVLLAGLVTFSLYLATTVVVFALGVSRAWVLPALVVIFFGVTRPLMAPVFAALRLRRQMAFQAFLEMREQEQDRG